jgi:hypothetical protein
LAQSPPPSGLRAAARPLQPHRNGAPALPLDVGDLAAVEEGAEDVADPAAPPVDVPTPDVWGTSQPLTLADLAGTSDWLDVLADLHTHARKALGLRFKVFDVNRGEPQLLGDWGSEVPTETRVLERYGTGRYLVRATGKGGGGKGRTNNLQEVRFAIAPPRGSAGSAPESGAMLDRLTDLLRETLRGERSALAAAPKADTATTPPPWFRAWLTDEVQPLLAAFAESKEKGGGEDLLARLAPHVIDRLFPRAGKAAAPAAADDGADDGADD